MRGWLKRRGNHFYGIIIFTLALVLLLLGLFYPIVLDVVALFSLFMIFYLAVYMAVFLVRGK